MIYYLVVVRSKKLSVLIAQPWVLKIVLNQSKKRKNKFYSAENGAQAHTVGVHFIFIGEMKE